MRGEGDVEHIVLLGLEKETKKEKINLKLKYQINFSQALSKMKHRIIQLILQSSNDCVLLIYRTISYICKTTEAVRDGRSNPRKLKNIKNDIHFSAYKSSL